MTVAEKKKKLCEYGVVRNRLRRLEEEKREILYKGVNTVAPLNDMPKGNLPSDRVGQTSVELEMIDERIDEVKIELKAKRQMIEEAIDTLDSELEKDVIFARYVMMEDFNTIADDVDRTRRTAEKIHGRALQKIFL